ncbi:hypothetical protein [Vibrio sp. VB16]|nr:hypothetical protein [Vibrio sp. VB16]
MEFLSGWQITPDTLIMVWLAWRLHGIANNHDKRISVLEKKDG